jgi:SAM-dependent methyltransferase
MHGSEAVSPWVARWAQLVAPGATVLDVACGRGRHTRFFAGRGCTMTAVDRDAEALAAVAGASEAVHADIENGPWPFHGRTFDAVVVTNYLWRPLLPTLVASVAPGGVLLYETFALGNEAFGKPSRPDFLLRPGELLDACASLEVVAYEHGLLRDPARVVQRIVACGNSRGRASLESPIPGEKVS